MPPIVETDASDYAIAGTFSPRTGDGCIHPVAFDSRTPNGVELSYDTHDKEFLAIYEAFKTWPHYLESLHYTVDAVRATVWISLQARGLNCDPVVRTQLYLDHTVIQIICAIVRSVRILNASEYDA